MSIPSTAGPFERWVTKLRVSWMGTKAKAIFGGWAAAMGDKTRTWAIQVLYEHLPELASNDSLPLIGSGRGLPKGKIESNADYASRLPSAIPQWRQAGSALGLLYALYLEGFGDAVLVQQNGRAYSLSLPLADDPSDSLVVTTLGLDQFLPNGPHAWFTFDIDDDWCSRFAVLFPNGNSAFITTATAVFDGSSLRATATWSNAFPDTTYEVMVGALTSTGPVTVAADPASLTKTTVDVVAVDAFVGTVTLLAYQQGANPFADLHPQDLANLQRAIELWKPKKATCMGIYVTVQGEMWDWPVGDWDDAGGVWGNGYDVVRFDAA